MEHDVKYVLLCPLGPGPTQEDLARPTRGGSGARLDCRMVDNEEAGIRRGCWAICSDSSRRN
jgi:hypothetical protein